MVAAFVALLQLAGQVHVTASVDRERAQVGDEVVYTVRATSEVSGAFRLELPSVTGLEIVDRTERSGLVVGSNPPTREYVSEIRLKATQVGTWSWSPVLVFVGAVSELAPDVSVTVVGAGSADPSASNPTLLGLIQRAPPPTSGSTATLGIVVSADHVVQGEQLDVLTTAWFPRSLRARLRRPPSLKPPVLSGVWSVPQPAVPGVVSSRTIGEETYDLFVSHQVGFPLTQGKLTIPPAVLEYGVPTSRRASGDEREVEAASDPVDVTVTALPDAGRPAGFGGPVGRSLKIGYRLRVLPARAGEPLPIELSITGDGNLAFWAPPNVVWPPGSRAYLDHVADQGRTAAGRLGGTKTYHYLLLADSVGSLSLPSVEYEYFDPSKGYEVATTPGVVVAVLAPTSTGPTRPPPPLVAPESDWPRWVGRIDQFALPAWLVALLLIGAGLAARFGRRLVRPRKPPLPTVRGVTALDGMIVALVPEDERGRREGIIHGFRQAGIDRDTALELVRLKTEVDRARFAAAEPAEPAALGTEVETVVARLPGPVRRSLGLLGVLVGLAGLARPARSQTESPEQLYRSGHPQVAAQAFATAAEQAPDEWQRWYDLAAAQYVAGQDAKAAAALERTFDLAPRARLAKALWTELEREHEPLHEASHASGLSVAEWRAVAIGIAAIAGLMIAFGWLPIAVRLALVLGAAGAAGWAEHRVAGQELPAGFMETATTLRISPHGLAPEQGGLGALSRVTVEGHAGRWLLVRDGHGSIGWVPRATVAPVRRLD